MPDNRASQLVMPHKFDDLNGREVGPRLTETFDVLYRAVNKDRLVQSLPAPLNLQATSALGGVYLSWEAIAPFYITSLYAAKIWRCLESDDATRRFADNSAKRELVPVILSTAWFDPTSDTNSYVYWVQWIDKLNRVSDPSSGKAAAGV